MKSLIPKFLCFLAEKSHDVFWIRNSDYSQQIYVNPAYQTIWQRDPEELYKHPESWADALHSEDHKNLSASVAKRTPHIKPGDNFLTEYRIIRPSGEIRFISDHSFAIFDSDTNQHIGFAGIARDITEEVHYTRNLKKAKKAAEAASQTKSEFIANISHDIRTPITGILGLAQSLHDNAENLQNRQDASLLIDTTQELLQLLNQVIEISKLHNGDGKTSQVIFSIRDLVKHNVNLFKAAAKHKKISLEYEISPSIPDQYLGNHNYLDRIILNLLGNAIKFTHTGGVKINVDVSSIKSNMAQLHLTVSDTGIGIPADQYQAIFEQFRRINPSYQGIYKGSGLGLSAVKKCLEAMKGTISLHSQINEGSSFTASIPLIISDAMQKHSSNTATIQPQAYAQTRVLIVDDNELAARMAAQILRKHDFDVENASNGQQAIQQVNEHHYDLVLMDIGLPDLNGLEVTQIIRQSKTAKQLPIIALSGHISEEMRARCLHAGIQHMLTKPISTQDIEQLINNYLQYEQEPQLLDLLTASLPQDLQQLQLLFNHKQLSDMRDLIHKIYGGLCYCDIPQLKQAASRLQQSLQDNNLNVIRSDLNAFALIANQFISDGAVSADNAMQRLS